MIKTISFGKSQTHTTTFRKVMEDGSVVTIFEFEYEKLLKKLNKSGVSHKTKQVC